MPKFTLDKRQDGTDYITKHMHRFKEVPGEGKPEIIGTLYIRSWLINQIGNPRDIWVSISTSDPSIGDKPGKKA